MDYLARVIWGYMRCPEGRMVAQQSRDVHFKSLVVSNGLPRHLYFIIFFFSCNDFFFIVAKKK